MLQIKLMVGPGGSKIQEIQRKSKARIQIKKDDEDLNRGFGEGPKLPNIPGLKLPPGKQQAGAQQAKPAAKSEDGDSGDIDDNEDEGVCMCLALAYVCVGTLWCVCVRM